MCLAKIDYEQGNLAHRPGHARIFPVPPIDSFQDMRSEMCLLMEQQGVPAEVQHHGGLSAGQCEIGTRFNTLVNARTGDTNGQVHDLEPFHRLR